MGAEARDPFFRRVTRRVTSTLTLEMIVTIERKLNKDLMANKFS